MEYNKQQQAAITAPLGRIAIVAGPGTGKTATVVERITYVVQHYAIQPDQVLAITFTRKAAAELRQRLYARWHGNHNNDSQQAVVALQPAAMTIHALAVGILQQAQPGFVVNPDQFDVLVSNAVKAVQTNRALCQALQQRWHYIVVDEFQDVDATQVELIELLGARHQNICVVGDPNQSIYGFRGAVPEALGEFCTADTQQFQLTTSYRSQANIIRASQALWQNTPGEILVLPLKPKRPAMSTVECSVQASPSGEAHYVIKQITALVGASDHLALATSGNEAPGATEAYTFSDIAVIYRLNAIGDQFERYLREVGLPYRRVGKTTIFSQPNVVEYLAQLSDAHLGDSQTLAQQLPEQFVAEMFDDFRLVVESFDDLPVMAARRALLDYVALAQPEDDYAAKHNCITLLTAHAAKGLEFPVVFIIGAEDGLFPYTEKSDCNVAEERRLFYVATTRAQDALYISAAKRRSIYGQTTKRPQSRFTSDLPTALVHTTITKVPHRLKQRSLF